MPRNHKKFIRTVYAVIALQSVNFTLPIYQIYASRELGFSLYQIASFYSTIWITSVVFDFVGGGIADKFGKNRSYAIGQILLLVASVLPFLILKSYTWFPLLAVVGGIGNALSSNTISAIVSNELSKTNPKLFKLLNSRQQAILFISRIIGSVSGGFLYSLNPSIPWILVMATGFASIVIAVLLLPNDTKVQQHSEETVLRKLQTVIRIYQSNFHKLTLPVLVLSTWSIGANIIFSYYQPYFSRLSVSSSQLGFVFAAISLFSAMGSWTSHRFVEKPKHIMTFMITMMTLQSVLFLMLPWQFSLYTVVMSSYCFGLTVPTIRHLVSKFSNRHNSTSSLSFTSSLLTISTILGFQISGHLADNGNLKAIIASVLVTQLGAAILLIYYIRSGGAQAK